MIEPDLMTQTAQGLFVREIVQDRDGVWSTRFYRVVDIEGTALTNRVILAPVTFEVRTAPKPVDD